MSALTAIGYFNGDIAIPGYSGGSAANTAIQNIVAEYIFQYEEQFLVKLLGQETYDDFIAGLATVPIPAKWTALKNQIFRSRSDGTSTRYDSPCARYIFFHYFRDSATSPATIGEVRASAENSTPTSPDQHLCQVWNRMCDRIEEIREWIEDDVRAADYPDYYRPADDPFTKINTFGI